MARAQRHGRRARLGHRRRAHQEVARSIRDARLHGSISDAELAKVRAYHEARAQGPSDDPDFGLARGTNLLILQVEAMQKWVIGAHDRGQELTPFLNRLRERAGSSTGCTTRPAIHRRRRRVHGAQFPVPAAPRLGCVPARRKPVRDRAPTPSRSGATPRSPGTPTPPGCGTARCSTRATSFDQTAFRDELGDGPKLGWGIGDKLFFQRVEPPARAPESAVRVTLTSHGPYQYVPPAERKLDIGAIEGSDFGGYLHSMRYNDEAIEQLFGQLQHSGLLANTTIVIYGDHDSRMKFPAGLAVGTDLTPDTQRRLAIRDYTTKQIPLFVVLPERLHAPPRVIHTLGGQVDIGATIAHLFGIQRPGSFIGQSLVPERVGHASRIDGSGVDGEHIYIAPGGGRCESFPDLQRLELSACAELSKKTQEELNMSWDVTLLDLASKLAGKSFEKAAAKR